jgi:hypothetical protein
MKAILLSIFVASSALAEDMRGEVFIVTKGGDTSASVASPSEFSIMANLSNEWRSTALKPMISESSPSAAAKMPSSATERSGPIQR